MNEEEFYHAVDAEKAITALTAERDRLLNANVDVVAHQRVLLDQVAAVAAERDRALASRDAEFEAHRMTKFALEAAKQAAADAADLRDQWERQAFEMQSERDQLRADLANQATRFHEELVRRQKTARANQELDLKNNANAAQAMTAALKTLLMEWFEESTKNYRPETRDIHHRTWKALREA